MIINTSITDDEVKQIMEFVRQWRLWQQEYFADLGRDDIEIIGKIVVIFERLMIEKIFEKQFDSLAKSSDF